MRGQETDRIGGSEQRSRRGLLKAAAVGAVALTAGPVIGRPEPATAQSSFNPPQPWFFLSRTCHQISPNPPVFICVDQFESEVGQITIGGVLLTYVSAPLNARGSLTYSLSSTRTETMRSITEDSRELTISATLGPFPTSDKRFGVGGSFERVQGRSTRVTNAITHSSTQTQSIQTAPVAGGGYNAWEHTAFLIMARPVLAIMLPFTVVNGFAVPPPAGSTPVFGQRFVHGGTIFPRSARQLRDDPGTRDFIGPETADAILAEYPLQPDQTGGGQLGLGEPRFGLVAEISPGEVPFGFSRSMTGTTTHIEERTRSVTTRIKSGFSLSISGVNIFKFEAQRSFTTRHTSVQENSNTEVVSVSGVLSSDLNRRNRIYEDRVWNTVLITDEGPLAQAFSAVSGTVVAGDGNPVEGAVVSVEVDRVPHETFTDQDGRYVLRFGGDVAPGEYEVICAGQSRSVIVSSGRTATANYRGVNPRLARARSQ